MAFNKAKVMDAARRAADKGQLDKAIREYLKIVREDPQDVRVWLKVGDLYAKKGAKQEAAETYLKVARFYSEQGFHRKAVAVYKQILKLDPRLVEVNLQLAELYRELGLYAEAMQHFERVAAFFHREGKTREALATIRQLLDLDPDNVATRIKLAELYSKEGYVESAVAEFYHALEYLRRHEREDDLLKVGERVLWHKPDDLELGRELAAAYLRQRDAGRALQKLQHCFKADARDVETLAMLAQAFQQLEQVDKTVSVLKELARVLAEDGQTAQAAEVHENILHYAPGDADSRAFLDRYRATAGGGEPEEAFEEASEPTERLSADDLHVAASARVTGAYPLVGDQHQPDAAIEQAESSRQAPLADVHLEEDAAGFDEVGAVSAEVHADEIIKILTESDVYVKYGLHQKAVDHLRQVFDLDPYNAEAREQLKDILLAQGREAEALAELLQLARQTAGADPSAAEMYLREVLAIDAGHPEAYELARQFGLQVADPDVAVVSETPGAALGPSEGGEVVPVEEAEFGARTTDAHPVGELAAGSPAPGPNPNAPEILDEAELVLDELGEGPSALGNPSTGTQELELDDVEVEGGGAAPSRADPAARGSGYPAAGEPFSSEGYAGPAPSSAQVDAFAEPGAAPAYVTAPGLGDPAAAPPGGYAPAYAGGVGIPEDAGGPGHAGDGAEAAFADALSELHAEPTPTSQEVPGPASAAVVAPGALAEAENLDDGAFEELGPAELAEVGDALDPGAGAYAGGDPDATSELGAAPPASAEPGETTDELEALSDDAIELVESTADDEARGEPERTEQHELAAIDPAAGTALEDDLDEADFFLSQGLLEEAREILDGLARRYPNHPLVLSKLEELAAADGAGAVGGGDTEEVGSETGPTAAPAESTATARSEPTDLGPASGRRLDSQPQVMLERPVPEEDADTHYDLGLAYKEMGLYEEAIRSFESVVHARGVPCYLMIGLCYREQSKHTQSITKFKEGLYVPGITEREKYSLYYEIGISYELLDDAREALYYAEAVMKKDPAYRDIGERVAKLRRKAAAESDRAEAAAGRVAPGGRSR